MQGDSLSIVLTLVSFTVSTAIAAYSVQGTKARNLWGLTGLFAIATVGWLAFRGQIGIPAMLIVQYLTAAVPAVTVALAAVMLSGKRSGESVPKGPVLPRSGVEEKVAPGVSKSLIDQIDSAIDVTDWHGYVAPQDSVDAGIAALESTFASLRKELGFDTPIPSERTQEQMEHGRNYLRQVVPFLRAGHVEEARQVSTG